MGKIQAKELKIKFIETLNELDGFNYENGNPFLIKIRSKQYFIFLKNLSPAYFKNSPDVTRVQLPYSSHFAKILKADIPFIILGYDSINDTLVCWNPKKVKERLNAKSNVSLYSRESLQSIVKLNEFKSGYLSNGERIIIFRRETLISFFDNISHLFKEKKGVLKSEESKILIEPVHLDEHDIDKLNELTDKILLNEIKPLLKKNKVLESVEVCTNFYGSKYKAMTFKDWFKLVNQEYKRINSK